MSNFLRYKAALEEADTSAGREKILLRAVWDMEGVTIEEIDELQAISDAIEALERSEARW